MASWKYRTKAFKPDSDRQESRALCDARRGRPPARRSNLLRLRWAVFYSALDLKQKRVPPEQLARVRHIQAQANVVLLIDH
ncbi:MAG TPA: hypothetical protein VHM88_10420, partial [Candidatus Acidoferrales bacterium]|nr:hypothetical protein [Candidatus Acidoferrales bacterium]